MTKTDKETIYNLLKNASALETGFISESFKSAPDFCDDNSKSDLNSPSEEKISLPVNSNSANNASEEKISLPESNQSKTIEDINAKILRCTRCQLARTRNNVIPGQGVEHPDVLVISEAPDNEEDIQGKPFVGKTGMLLDKMLAAIDLDRTKNCYICNIVKCHTPENRDPLADEQSACFSFLEAQIHILKPKMILCMGRVSAHKMLNLETPIGELHGKFFEYNEIPLMVTYHPSSLLRNEALKRPAWEDLKSFKAKLNELQGGN